MSRRTSLLALVVIAVVLVHLGYKGARELSIDRNSRYYLREAFNSLSQEELAREDDQKLVMHFDIKASLPDQINARRKFCARHRDASVIAGSILYHPVCLVDMGTYDFSGWGNKTVDLLSIPEDRSLIILAADAKKLAPLAVYYGDRYMARGNIAFIKSRESP